jgi:hypothetical protein
VARTSKSLESPAVDDGSADLCYSLFRIQNNIVLTQSKVQFVIASLGFAQRCLFRVTACGFVFVRHSVRTVPRSIRIVIFLSSQK